MVGAHAVSDTAPGLGLDPAVRIDAVGCETGFPVDDVGVALTGGGFILAQAKRGMRRLDTRAADLRSAVDQLVHAMIDGLNVNDVAMRPVDETRDRLVIVTSHDGSRSFDVLGRVCERLRGQPPSTPVRSAGVTEEGRTALETLAHRHRRGVDRRRRAGTHRGGAPPVPSRAGGAPPRF